MKQSKPLDGIRVLDIASFIAAPFAATIMAEFGADVIKVEPPGGGDPWRRYGTDSGAEDRSLAWLTEARNKRSITLNLKDERGAALFKRLAAGADVVCENFRPGTLEKWGLGWDTLSAINRGLILLRVTGYGQDGPYAQRPGFARIAHAYGGVTHLAGNPGEAPVTPGSTSLADYMTGMYGCIGVMMALRHRDATGDGQVIDCALYESIFRALDEIAPRYGKDGFVRQPEGTGTVNAVPHGHFPTADGKWIALACTTDKMFARLCAVMARPDLQQAYGAQKDRLAARSTVLAEVEAWTAAQQRDALVDRCNEAGVPCGAVNTIADIFADPHIMARGTLTDIEVPGIGPVTVPAALPRLSESPGSVDTLGPPLGDANDAVYGELLGLSAEDRSSLAAAGVI